MPREDEHSDEPRDEWIGVVPTGQPDDHRGRHDPNRGEQIGEHLEVRAFDVQALVRAFAEQEHRDHVDREPDQREHEHQAALDRLGISARARSPRSTRTPRRRGGAPRWPARRVSRAGRARRSDRYAPIHGSRHGWPASAMPRPTRSVSMWAASDSSASEFVTSPPTTSTTKNTAMRPNAHHRRPRWRGPARAPAAPGRVGVPMARSSSRFPCCHGPFAPPRSGPSLVLTALAACDWNLPPLNTLFDAGKSVTSDLSKSERETLKAIYRHTRPQGQDGPVDDQREAHTGDLAEHARRQPRAPSPRR